MKNFMMLIAVVLVSSLGFAQTSNYEDGSVKSQYTQQGDLVAVTHYYESGMVKETGFFKNEIPEGKWETFSEEGTKTAELNYQEGKRHGEFRVWDEFASTYTEMHYSNGDVVVANKWVKQVEFASTEE
ncbi:MAG: antitoxin component YwqK of YwqJK toxin-antitoxin module [Bacteroidia bacterium]|jgi:antitoxin component YwqK of YwqJK toxin-antitoxin module